MQVNQNLSHRPVRLAARRGRRVLTRPEPLLVQEDEAPLGVLVHDPHHRPGSVRAR